METTKVLKLYKQITSIVGTPFPDRDSAVTSFKYSAKRMGNAPTISATFLYKECLDDKWSDSIYTVFNGEKYRLRNTPSSSFDNTSCLYKHNLEFVSERVVLESVYFFDVVLNDGAEGDPLSTNSDFMFTGGLNEFAERFNRSAKWSGLDYTVTIDEGVTAEEKPMKFQDQFLYDAIKTMYDTFDVPFYFKGTDIHIGYAENEIEDIIRYGVDDALISVNRNNTGEQIINRITGIGSDRNITYYYPNPTPKGTIELQFSSSAKYEVRDHNVFANNMDLERELVFSRVSALIIDTQYSQDGIEYTPYNKEYIDIIAPKERWFLIKFNVARSGYVYVDVEFDIPGYSPQPVSYFYRSSDLIGNGYSHLSYIKDRGVYCGKLDKGNYELKLHVEFIHVGTSMYSVSANPSIRDYYFWHYIDNDYEFHIEDASIVLVSGQPSDGDTMKQALVKRVTVQNNLMPYKYRERDGLERFYNAENGRYADENNTSIYFPNPHSETRPREYILRDEEIYPSITGMTNANSEYIDEILDVAYDKFDNDEIYPEGDPDAGKYKHPYFFIKLRKFDGEHGFNLFDHAIENNQMTISMTTGSCGACEFTIGVNDNNKNTVQVDEDGNLLRDDYGNVRCSREGMPVETPQDVQNDTVNNEVWIALKKDTNTYGVVMPNVTNKQYVNAEDKFVILHIDLPEAYVLAAEKRLENAVIKYMAEHNSEKYSYSVKFSRIFFEENDEIAPLINENAKICLEYNGKIEELYVTSFSYNMSDSSPLPEISIELEPSITIKKGVIQQLREQSNNILKPQLVAINKSLNSNEITIKTLQTTVSNTNQSNQLLIGDIQNRLLTLEESTGVVDLTELKIQVNNIDDRVTNVEKRVAVKVVTVPTT